MASEAATRSPSFIDGKSQNAQELRLHALSSGGGATPLASRGGVRPSGGNPGLVAALATPVMKVRVNAGIADVPSTSASGGFYRLSWDQVDLDIDVSSAQARTDLVIVEVVDTGTSAATGKVRVLKGTSGAGRPSNGVANAHWLSLASVAVRIGAESGGNIRAQDVTPESYFAVAPGGVLPVANASVRAALAAAGAVWDGLVVVEQDTDRVWLCTGGSPSVTWRYVGGGPPPTYQVAALSGWSLVAGLNPVAWLDGSGLGHTQGVVSNIGAFTPGNAILAVQLPAQVPRPVSGASFPVMVYDSGNGSMQFVRCQWDSSGRLIVIQGPAISAGSFFYLDGIAPWHPTTPGTGVLA